MDWTMLALCVLAGFGSVFIILMFAMEATYQIQKRQLKKCRLYKEEK